MAKEKDINENNVVASATKIWLAGGKMPPKCDEHSGFCARIEDQENDISGLKITEREQWKEINKKTSTATLLIIVGIIASCLMGVIGLAYTSHQSKMTKLEATDTAIFQKIEEQNKATLKEINDHYDKINAKLDDLKDLARGKPFSPKGHDSK